MAFGFFRKHKRLFWILMFLGVLGFVGFGSWPQFVAKWEALFGSAEQKREVARMGDTVVQARDVGTVFYRVRLSGQAMEAVFQALAQQVESQEQAMGLYAHTVGRSAWPFLAMTLPDRDDFALEPAVAWYGLYKEAERLGFTVPEEAVEGRLQALGGLGLTAEMLRNVIAREAMGDRHLFVQALQLDMTLAGYVEWLVGTLSTPVEPELKKRFVRVDERVQAKVVVLKDEDFVDDVAAPTDEAVQAAFEAHKDKLPGPGAMDFGYKIPNQVAVEYLAAEVPAFMEASRQGITDEAVEVYYEANKDAKFAVREEPAEAEEGEGEVTYRPVSEVRGEIVEALAEEEAERLAKQAMNDIVAEVRSVKEPPDLRVWADGTRITYHGPTELLTPRELASLEGLGRATDGQRTVPQVAPALVDLVGPAEARVALKEISEVFTDPSGRPYAFRVTSYRESFVPQTVDRVRDRVVEDLKRQAAMARAREAGRHLLEAAAESGLDAAAEARGTETVETDLMPRQLTFSVGGGRQITMPAMVPGVGSDERVVDALFTLRPAGPSRTLVALPERQTVVVAELVKHAPPRQAMYDLMRPMLMRETSRDVGRALIEDILAPEAVMRRLGLVVTWEPEAVEDEAAAEGEGGEASGQEAAE